MEGRERIDRLEFSGHIEPTIFTGTTVAGAHRTEIYTGDERVRTHIEYELDGADADGRSCRIHVVNHRTPDGRRPAITTEHPALAWLNDADLSAVVEPASDGPTIRFFAGHGDAALAGSGLV